MADSKLIQTETGKHERMPLPIALGGLGLLLAELAPGGLSGEAGFLLGFLSGLFLPVLITVMTHWNQSRPRVSATERVTEAASTTSQPLYDQINLTHER